MKSLLRLGLAFSFTMTTVISPGNATLLSNKVNEAATSSSAPPIDNLIDLPTHGTLTLGTLLAKFEKQILTNSPLSFRGYINSRNTKTSLKFLTKNNSIRLEVEGKSATIVVLPSDKIQINGISLTKSDFESAEALFQRIQKILKLTQQPKHFTLLEILFNGLVPTARADSDWAMAGAVVLGLGLLAGGIYYATKNLKKTQHTITVQTPPSIDVNHNVAVKASGQVGVKAEGEVKATGTLNTNLNASLNATGVPDHFDLNINTPGLIKTANQ